MEDINADLVASQFRPQIQKSSVFITIQDVNDNQPAFKEPFYKVLLPENTPKDTEILTVTAEDIDVNRTITYNLEGNFDIFEILDVDPLTGQIFIR